MQKQLGLGGVYSTRSLYPARGLLEGAAREPAYTQLLCALHPAARVAVIVVGPGLGHAQHVGEQRRSFQVTKQAGAGPGPRALGRAGPLKGAIFWYLGDESLGRVDDIIYMDHILGLSLLSLTQVSNC